MKTPLNIVFLGLSVTSSWGNGHATNYRGLLRTLTARGHEVLFLERDVPWYAENRDMADPPWGRTELYTSLADLKRRFKRAVREADAVVLGSYVPQGVAVGQWVTATAQGVRVFYDIDTPVTLAKLAKCDYEYLAPHLIPRFDLYLSFTGGPTLQRIERQYGSPMARAFYCMVDPALYYPPRRNPGVHRRRVRRRRKYDLGYLGTYSADRQQQLEKLLIRPARSEPRKRFIVAGPQYPGEIRWPENVERVEHLPPADHRRFYTSQRFTLNVTRADMRRAGYSPSVRLFEAAACGTPIISDIWPGIEEVLRPGSEILLAATGSEILRYLNEMSEAERRAIGARARRRVLREHTAEHRALELERHLAAARALKARPTALAAGA
jgi:spore maturation protein CgeB